MTQEAKAHKIIRQNGSCTGIHCDLDASDECPCWDACKAIDGDNSCHPDKVKACKKFLDKKLYNDAISAGERLLTINNPASKYNRPITGLDGTKTTVDVYRVLVAFGITDPELQHSLKKLLNLGIRGKGDYTQDLDEAVLSLQKMKERKEQECK